MRPKQAAVVLTLLLGLVAVLHSVALAPLLVSDFSSRRADYLANPVLLWAGIGFNRLLTLFCVTIFAVFLLFIGRLKHLWQGSNYRWLL